MRRPAEEASDDDLRAGRVSGARRSRRSTPSSGQAMEGERRRQHDKIELIASENYTFGRRDGGPGQLADEQVRRGPAGQALLRRLRVRRRRRALAQERALELFPGAEHVNVQPHSGAQANMAAYFSVLEPGDRILGMKLAQGGHLTHGMALNFSGRLYEVHAYGVDRTPSGSTTTRSRPRPAKSGPR